MSLETPPGGGPWSIALELAPDRSVRAGSKAALAAAIGRGADLRVYTEFVFEEHIVPGGNGDPNRPPRFPGVVTESHERSDGCYDVVDHYTDVNCRIKDVR